MTALRFGVAGIVLLPLLLRQGIWGLAGIGWRRGVALAAFAGVPFSLLMFWGLRFAPAAHGAALIPGSIPVATAFGLWLSAGVRISPAKLMMLALIITGLGLVSGLTGDGGAEVLFGDLLFVMAGTSWSVYAILLRRWQLDPLPVATVVSVLSLAYLPVYFLLLAPDMSSASLEQILFQAFNQGILNSVVALLLFSQAVRILGPQLTSLGNATVPVLAALLAAPILGEPPTAMQWLGILLVVSGVVAAARL